MLSGGIPNWCCDRIDGTDRPDCSRSGHGLRPAAILLPALCHDGRNASTAPAPRHHIRSSARSPLRRCRGPVAPAPRSACSRQSPGNHPACRKQRRPRWVSVGPMSPARPSIAVARRNAVPADAHTGGSVDETPASFRVFPTPTNCSTTRIWSCAALAGSVSANPVLPGG